MPDSAEQIQRSNDSASKWDTTIRPDEVICYKRTTQQSGEPVDLHLHRFRPTNNSQATSTPQPVAALVLFFGGGWSRGDVRQFYDQADCLKSLGVMVFCAEYRVRDQRGTPPECCMQDARSAMRWVRVTPGHTALTPIALRPAAPRPAVTLPSSRVFHHQ